MREGACALHVDPGAVAEGDGSSWASPLRSVQAAIDAQDARGGGEVWVRAGGPYAAFSGAPDATLLELRAGVHLLGGFAGTEESADDRDPAARTVIAGAPFGEDYENPPLIVGASDVTLDGFSIVGQKGPALVLRNATGVRVRNLTLEDNFVWRAALIELVDGDARVEGLRVIAATTVQGVPGLLVAGSTVRVAASEFRSTNVETGGHAGILASSSKVTLDGVWFVDNNTRSGGRSAGLSVEDSDLLVMNSVWLGNHGDHESVVVRRSRFVAVNSHWEGNGHAVSTVSLSSTDATFLNTSFVNNRSYHSAIVVCGSNTQLEFVNTTFADNENMLPRASTKRHDVAFSDASQVALYNSYSNRGSQSTSEPFTSVGSCLLEGAEPYRETTEEGLTKVLLRPGFGCTNKGNTAATKTATKRATQFAVSLGETIPLAGAWWRTMSSVLSVPVDRSPIDPGRHYYGESE